MTMSSTYWTNSSVLGLAGSLDPIDLVTNRARELVLLAKENGWNGPPFDPFWLAEYLGIPVVPREDVIDSRAVPVGPGKIQIEYNPSQPYPRVRFSLAHEIAHVLFPDCAKTIRNRLAGSQLHDDDWQLELLCNLAAAEFLMPIGTPVEMGNATFGIDKILRLKERYEVSTEAMLLRVIRLTHQPIAAFAASRIRNVRDAPYRIEYSFPSASFSINIPLGLRISHDSILAECTGVGYTAKGRETWNHNLPEFYIECVGVPPYRENSFPRVLGLVSAGAASGARRSIRYLQGDATEPRGTGLRIVAHIVNDRTWIWGAGFGKAVRNKWPAVQEDFRKWAMSSSGNLKLGNVHFTKIRDGLIVFQMAAQHGYGGSKSPRIRYSALNSCLKQLAEFASDRKASVHMPFIGIGEAGGEWAIIEELIRENLIDHNIDVAVYKLPRSRSVHQSQSVLPLSSALVAE